MTAQARVSVIIPLFNKAPYIIEAIASVLAQGPGVGEVIVVDDGSIDEGPKLVAEMAKLDGRVHLLSQKNSGVSSARNTGIRLAQEEFLAFLDADDWYLPGYIDAMLGLLQLHKVAMVCSGYLAVFSDGRRQEHLLKPKGSSEWCGEVKDFYRAWSKASFTCTNAIVLRRDVLLLKGIYFPEDEGLGEDQEVWFRMAENGGVIYRNAPLVAYRMEVIGSATFGMACTEILPCYRRLSERLSRNEVPAPMVRGAQRLVASHILNVANAQLVAGNVSAAWMLLSDFRVWANPIYLMRSLYKYVRVRLTGDADLS